MRAIIAAAGTGGHINPGIAIANKIKKEEPNSEIMFIGTNRGIENDLVPRAGYELKNINAYGFDRKISLDNIKKILQTIYSIKEAKKIIDEFKPDVIIGTGGYVCIPVCMASKKRKVQFVLHESNAFPGMAIKFLSKTASLVLLGFEDAKTRLPNAKKVVVTGTPTKVKKIEVNKKQVLDNINLDYRRPLVFAFGGSQGAQSINKALISIIKEKKNSNYQLIWAAGPSQYDSIKEELAGCGINVNNIKDVRILPYVYNMEEILNCVDLVVCRSGAMTITEVSNVGIPAIFIPFPYATENHQEYNARVLEKVGAAKIILDKNLNSDILNKYINSIILDKKVIYEMAENAKKVGIKNVEDKIYESIKQI